jgi:predicted PurR-regulated permease PerM
MPRFSGKRQVVDIAKQIESDVSAYLLTITAMNAAVGIATAAAMWLSGVGDPILWGTIAFLLNFVGCPDFPARRRTCRRTVWLMLLPAGLYLGIHLVEGETITPMLLARRASPVRYTQEYAVIGSMTVMVSLTRVIGKPARRECSRTRSSLSAR